jgi:methylmalonyl-CoA mutase cobalamin-binding domain/chain
LGELTLPNKSELTLSSRLLESLLDCDRLKARTILDEAAKCLGTEKVFSEVIPSALNSLGVRWAKGELALTQIYAASRIVEEAMDRLSPDLQTTSQLQCKVVVGALDYHGLGKNIITKFLRASGVEVIDLGTNISPERISEEAIKNKVDAILVSALMLHVCFQAERIKQILNNQGLKIPIMVGGAPFNFDNELWKKVGADAKGKNICETFSELKELIKK